MSIITPRSHCFHCDTELGTADLVPLLSYLWLRGLCRYCGVRISGRYFLVELVTGLAFAALYLHHRGAIFDFVSAALFAGVLIPVFFIDLEYTLIPAELTAAGMLIGVGSDLLKLLVGQGQPLEWLVPGTTWLIQIPASLVGLCLGGAVFASIVVLGRVLFGREAMGGGDVHLAAAIGAKLGPGYAFLTFFLLAVGLGALIGVLLIALRLRSRQDYIPFGPFMVVSAFLLLFWGEALTRLIRQCYPWP